MPSSQGIPNDYYSDRQRGTLLHEDEDTRLKVEIKAVFNRYKGSVGSPAITEWLRRQGETVGENWGARFMCEMELMAKGKRKFRHTTDSNHDLPIAQNHLDRQFKVSSPNETWVTDITYIPTREGWLYLCVFVNLFSRIVVGYAMEEHMRTTLVTKALLHTLKVELVHDDDFHTRKEAKEKIIEYIELYYNSVRLHSTLGQMSPMEFERKESA